MISNFYHFKPKQLYKKSQNLKMFSRFRVYYRIKSNSPFIFLGSTTNSSVIKERTISKSINSLPRERLQIRLVIPANNVQDIQIDTQFEGVGKYKKAVLQHSEFDTKVNINLGFYSRL
jgi:hypothetical protein